MTLVQNVVLFKAQHRTHGQKGLPQDVRSDWLYAMELGEVKTREVSRGVFICYRRIRGCWRPGYCQAKAVFPSTKVLTLRLGSSWRKYSSKAASSIPLQAASYREIDPLFLLAFLPLIIYHPCYSTKPEFNHQILNPLELLYPLELSLFTEDKYNVWHKVLGSEWKVENILIMTFWGKIINIPVYQWRNNTDNSNNLFR